MHALRLWPRSLYGRLVLILFAGLLAAHMLSFILVLRERADLGRAMMRSTLGRDIAAAVAVFEQTPPTQRTDWAQRFDHDNCVFFVGTDMPGNVQAVPHFQEVIDSIAVALGPRYPISVTVPDDVGEHPRLDLHLHLSDRTPVTVELLSLPMPLSPWLFAIATVQFCILAAITWVAVLMATRPLGRLARAADALPAANAQALQEDGPLEVAKAARAFNLMRSRITGFLAERARMLGAIAHDLQTPITRMRLRVELMEEDVQRDKLLGDLQAMQALVEEGVAYASHAHGLVEEPRRIDPDALLQSLVYDYSDGGQAVSLTGAIAQPLLTRPQAVRRVLTNLVDNALKFGGQAEVHVAVEGGHAVIEVRDRGPGIDAANMEAVFQPFYRIENSRNRETGGTGLGLAIARQLALALGGELVLSNREGGGLLARFTLPLHPAA